jgi:hypothetical protein
MITLVLHLLRIFPFLYGGPRQLALENLALHHQLAVYKRTVARPNLRPMDRLFWVGLAGVWAGWRRPLWQVQGQRVITARHDHVQTMGGSTRCGCVLKA